MGIEGQLRLRERSRSRERDGIGTDHRLASPGGGARRGGGIARYFRVTRARVRRRSTRRDDVLSSRRSVVRRFDCRAPWQLAPGGRVVQRTIQRAVLCDCASVAGRRLDAFDELRLNGWDLAAGTLLIREAGGIGTTMDGAPAEVRESSLLTGSPPMHAWLLRTLRTA